MSLGSCTILLSGAPASYDLRAIKSKVEETLGRRNVVERVRYCKTPDGKKIAGRFEVALASSAGKFLLDDIGSQSGTCGQGSR